MKIIVVGAGEVGIEIIRRLSEENHDILVIEKDSARIERILESDLDVNTIKGSGASAGILRMPELAGSHLLVAVTDSDEINIISCVLAKRLNIPRTVARIRDPEYARELNLFEEHMDIDLAVNPEYATAMEIGQLLTITLPVHTELLANGKILLADVVIDNSMSNIADKKLKDISLPKGCLIVAICRHGDMVIPGGNDSILPGDTVYLLGKAKSVNMLSQKIKRDKPKKINDVIIIGGGRIPYYLAEKLNSLNIQVKIIEGNPTRCRLLAENLPDTLVLNEDASDMDMLKREGLKEADGFIAATGMDEENLIIALSAKQLGVKKVVAVVGRLGYTSLVEQLGVDTALSPRLIMVQEIMRFIRGGRIPNLYLLLDGQAEVFELIVQHGSAIAGKSLKDLGLPKGAIIGAVSRGEESFIPQGESKILENDRLVIFALGHTMQKVETLFGLGGAPFE